MAKKERKQRKAKERRGSFGRNVMIFGGSALLLIVIVIMLLGNFFDQPILDKPAEIISNIMTPIQNGVSRGVSWVTGYFRAMKYRSNLEYEYEQALLKLEELQDQAMLADEYAARLNAYQDLSMESIGNEAMHPLSATVIGHDTGNYFSTLELDKGTRDGVQNYMAVVYSGGLVGYTYDVRGASCKVATIIDSDTTIPALMESSRDQGSVKGTYGLTGEALCRMYYLPENHLPRTGDIVVTSGVGMPFPKGIPIGTVRESTRGMEDNKQYVVIQPIVDFQHLEYVIIYRYIPSYAETAQLSNDTSIQTTLVPLSTARPLPEFATGVGTSFEEAGLTTPIPAEETTPEPEVTETPAPTAELSPTPGFTVATRSPEPNLEYNRSTPTPVGPTPSPTPVPTPTPIPEFDMDAQHFEEEEED